MKKIAYSLLAIGLMTGSSLASEYNKSSEDFEVAFRYFYSQSKTKYTLYDDTGNYMLSRLSWKDTSSHAGELFAKGYLPMGIFLQGYAGFGSNGSGSLQDEDFVTPLTTLTAYSSTNSKEKYGQFAYGVFDIGYSRQINNNIKIGGFLGYSVHNDVTDSVGCQQTASNTQICNPSLSDSEKAIKHDYTWQAMRLGLNTELSYGKVKWYLEAAYLPYIYVNGKDYHWQRIGSDFSGPTPFNGTGNVGVQLDTRFTYYFTKSFDVGIGARYWKEDAKGNTDFSQSTTTGIEQVSKFSTERFGGYFQAGYRF